MKKLNFIPFLGRVLILPADPEDVTKGGIIIPENAKKKPDLGTVVAVSSECEHVKPGDQVIHEPNLAIPLIYQGEEYSIVHEDQIMGVYEVR